MSIPVAIEQLYAAAYHSDNGRHVCPKCNGGSDNERCLSLRMDEAGGLHWRCFRSSCGYTGGPRGVRSVFAELKREARHYTRPIKPLTAEQRLLILAKFGISPDEIGGYDEHDDRVVLEVYGPTGYNKRGVVAYSLSGGEPKTKVYNERPEQPFIHFAGITGSTDIVVVEDWFSAEKVADTALAVGVAIMGTNLTQAAVTEIAELANRTGAKVWLAFDQDAYEKSLNYLFKYREQFPGGLFAWRLKQDLKYETTNRITEALVDGRTNFFDRTTASSGNDGGSKSL